MQKTSTQTSVKPEITSEKNNNQYVIPLFIGGRGGAYKGQVATNWRTFFRRISRIQIWAAENTFRGIELTFGHEHGDQTKVMLGNASGSHKQTTFRADETITEFSLWGNGAGTRTGGITIKTNKGQNFHHRMTRWGLKTEYKAKDMGSGICCGYISRSGGDIDAFGLVFLKPVKEVRNRIVPQNPRFAGDFNLIYDHIYSNTTNTKDTWSIERTFSKTNSISVTETQSVTHSFGVGVKYESPEIAAIFGGKISIELTYGFDHTRGSSNSSSYTEQHGISARQSGTILPGQRILVTVKARETDLETRYTGRSTVTLHTGYKFSYNVSGTFKSKMFGSGKTESRVLKLGGKDVKK